MTVTITGTVTVGGTQYPVSTTVELPDAPARTVPQKTRPAKGNLSPFMTSPPGHLRSRLCPGDRNP